MVALPKRYYVQTSQTDSTFGPPRGWETKVVTFSRDEAERYAESFEHATLSEQGENVSELVSTVARVIAEDDPKTDPAALAQAELETTKQLWVKLAEWAATLVDPST